MNDSSFLFFLIKKEYDGGSDYSGPNFSQTSRICTHEEKPKSVKTYDGVREIWPCISWGGWLSPNATFTREGVLRTEPTQLSLAEWPFVDLSKKSSISFPLNVKPDMRGTKVLVSVAGIKKNGAAQGVTKDRQVGRFEVDIDGHKEVVPFPISFDRSFFSFVAPPLSPLNQPRLTVSLITEGISQGLSPDHHGDETTPPPMLCHVQVHQYKLDVASIPTHTIGAFPVFGEKKTIVGYRPTLDGCAMRRMQSTCFCPVCLEQLWRRVLPRTGLLRSSPSLGGQLSYNAEANTLSVSPASLADGRDDKLEITWFSQTQEADEMAGEGYVLSLNELTSPTCLKLIVRFKSGYIRREPRVFQEELSVFLSSKTPMWSLTDLPRLLDEESYVRELAKQCLSVNQQGKRRLEWVHSSVMHSTKTRPQYLIQAVSNKTYGYDLHQYDLVSIEKSLHETFYYHTISVLFSMSMLLLLSAWFLKSYWRCGSFAKTRVS